VCFRFVIFRVLRFCVRRCCFLFLPLFSFLCCVEHISDSTQYFPVFVCDCVCICTSRIANFFCFAVRLYVCTFVLCVFMLFVLIAPRFLMLCRILNIA